SVPPAQAPVPESLDVSSFARVPDITRKLNRQNTAEAVLNTTASEIGSQWNLGRCIAALRRPGVVTSAVKEFVGPGNLPAQSDIAEHVVCTLHELAISRGAQVYPDTVSAPELQALSPQLSSLGVRSLLVLPLTDGNDHLGVLLLAENTPRSW